eukprot:4994374-Ditylum_brightwellii.AAC.1
MALKVVISTAVARGYCFMREESVVFVVSSLVSLSLLTLGCCCSFAVPPPRGSAMKKREEEEEIASIELFGIKETALAGDSSLCHDIASA